MYILPQLKKKIFLRWLFWLKQRWDLPSRIHRGHSAENQGDLILRCLKRSSLSLSSTFRTVQGLLRGFFLPLPPKMAWESTGGSGRSLWSARPPSPLLLSEASTRWPLGCCCLLSSLWSFCLGSQGPSTLQPCIPCIKSLLDIGLLNSNTNLNWRITGTSGAFGCPHPVGSQGHSLSSAWSHCLFISAPPWRDPPRILNSKWSKSPPFSNSLATYCGF